MKKRTSQQNRSLHLFLQMLTDALNNAGLDMRIVLKPSVSLPWTKTSTKEFLWRPIQESMFDKRSTTELDKHQEITKIHEVLMRHLGEKFGVEYVPFPSYERGYVDTAPLKSQMPRYDRPLTPIRREKVRL